MFTLIINFIVVAVLLSLLSDIARAFKKLSSSSILSASLKSNKKTITIFPASHFVVGDDKLKQAIERIKKEILLLAKSGTQTVKLVDRTFNANKARANALRTDC